MKTACQPTGIKGTGRQRHLRIPSELLWTIDVCGTRIDYNGTDWNGNVSKVKNKKQNSKQQKTWCFMIAEEFGFL